MDHCSFFSFHLYWGLEQEIPASKFGNLVHNYLQCRCQQFFSVGTLQKTLHWASCLWTAFTARTFFLVITLFSALKYNGKMKGYGNKFPVLIEQSFLEKNYYTRQVSLCKLKRTIPNEIFLGWKSTAQ